MATTTEQYSPGDVICLVNPSEIIIGRVVTHELHGVLLDRPHLLIPQQTARGTSIGFMPYGGQAFLVSRKQRAFSFNNFVAVDKPDAEITQHFSSFLSGIKPVAKPSIIM